MKNVPGKEFTITQFRDGWAVLVNQKPLEGFDGTLSYIDAHHILNTCNTVEEVRAALAKLSSS